MAVSGQAVLPTSQGLPGKAPLCKCDPLKGDCGLCAFAACTATTPRWGWLGRLLVMWSPDGPGAGSALRRRLRSSRKWPLKRLEQNISAQMPGFPPGTKLSKLLVFLGTVFSRWVNLGGVRALRGMERKGRLVLVILRRHANWRMPYLCVRLAAPDQPLSLEGGQGTESRTGFPLPVFRFLAP